MKKETEMNMVVFKRTRKRPTAGDIFVWQIVGQPYRFGRVIRDDITAVMGDERLYLIYCYRTPSNDPSRLPDLSRDDLLVSPMFVDSDPWTYYGIFRNVAHRPLRPEDVLRKHCFWRESRGAYVDEDGNRLRRRIEPCGDFALTTLLGICHDLSKALGLEFVDRSEREAEESRRFRERMSALAAEAAKLPEPQIPAFKEALKTLLDEVERIGRRHDDLYDTAVREAMAVAVLRAFVFDEQDYELPRDFGLESRRANAAVRRALQAYIDKARGLAGRHGLRDPAQRLRVFEDIEVTSAGGETYDEFFGASL